MSDFETRQLLSWILFGIYTPIYIISCLLLVLRRSKEPISSRFFLLVLLPFFIALLYLLFNITLPYQHGCYIDLLKVYFLLFFL